MHRIEVYTLSDASYINLIFIAFFTHFQQFILQHNSPPQIQGLLGVVCLFLNLVGKQKHPWSARVVRVVRVHLAPDIQGVPCFPNFQRPDNGGGG